MRFKHIKNFLYTAFCGLLRSLGLSSDCHRPFTSGPSRSMRPQICTDHLHLRLLLPAGGRYLSDGWVLDLSTMAWTQLHLRAADAADAPDAEASDGREPAAAQGSTAAAGDGAAAAGAPPTPKSGLPPLAGHTLTVWNGALLVLGGHVKPKDAPPSMLAGARAAGHAVVCVPLLSKAKGTDR